jgi:hypothetical protein
VRPRLFRLVPAGIVLATLSACTSSSAGTNGLRSAAHPETPASPVSRGETFTRDDVSFSYPSGWKPLTVSDSSASTGSQAWSRAFGIDGRNLVSVSAFELGVSITDANLQARSESIRSQLDSLFAQAGGFLAGGPAPQEMGGLPGLSFTGTAKNPNGRTVHSRLILAFDGRTEFFVNCQYDEQGRERILSGCDRVVSTFSVRG